MATIEKAIQIKHYLPGGMGSAVIKCLPGAITVLTDENGGTLPVYELCLTGKSKIQTVAIEANGNRYAPPREAFVGFNDPLPDDIGARDYLKSKGIPDDEVERLLEEYDLKAHAYLACSVLSSQEQRQLVLLVALLQKSDLIVLKDPFLPFSGRWREHFAEVLLREVTEKKRTLIILNLSFMPQAWSKSDLMTHIDVGFLAEEIRAKYEEKVRREKIEAARKAKLEEEQRKAAPLKQSKDVSPTPTDQKAQSEPTPPADDLEFKHREITDWLFSPLAKISEMMRTFSGASVVFGTAGLVALTSIILFPDLHLYWGKLSTMAKNFSYSWSDVTEGAKNTSEKGATTSERNITGALVSAPNAEFSTAIDYEEETPSQPEADPALVWAYQFIAPQSPPLALDEPEILSSDGYSCEDSVTNER